MEGKRGTPGLELKPNGTQAARAQQPCLSRRLPLVCLPRRRPARDILWLYDIHISYIG